MMKKKSAEDVLKNTFEHLDKVVDEKKAEKDAGSGRDRNADRPRRKDKVVKDKGKTRMVVASAQDCLRSWPSRVWRGYFKTTYQTEENT